jgi:hypothetical protein
MTLDTKNHVVYLSTGRLGPPPAPTAHVPNPRKHPTATAGTFHLLGSGCSVIFGKNVTAAAPGSAQGLYLIVSDIAAARNELLRRGFELGEVFHDAGGVYAGPDEPTCLDGSGSAVRIPSIEATARPPRSVIWTATAGCSREITTRIPGRVTGDTMYASANDLSQALRRAAAAHGQHEARTGRADTNWPDWYAEYMVREQAGEKLPQ